MERHGTALVCSLNIEEVRLIEWARRAGLLRENPKLSTRLNPLLTEQTLQQLQDLMLDTNKLKIRYKLDIRNGSRDETMGITENTPLDDGFLVTDVLEQPRNDILRRARIADSVQMISKRLWWAAVDKQRFQDLLADIQNHIQRLWRLLDGVLQDEILRNVNRTLESLVTMDEKLDRLLDFRDAIQLSQARCSEQHTVGMLHSVDIACAAELKVVRMLGQDKSSSVMVDGRSEIPALDEEFANRLRSRAQTQGLLDRQLLQTTFDTEFDAATVSDGERRMLIYNHKPVLVEWKRMEGPASRKISTRITNLAALLGGLGPSPFLSLNCLGIVKDEQPPKVGFVFEHPMPQGAQDPITLRAAMSTKLNLLPSVTERLRLAKLLIKAVRLLHVAKWYHKDMRSDNILFFPPASAHEAHGDSQAPIESLRHPFLAGFTWARESDPLAVSEQPLSSPQRDIYRHPNALALSNEGFDPYKELYSLGLVLCEIARWTPLSAILQHENVVDLRGAQLWNVHLQQVQQHMSKTRQNSNLEKVAFRMGDRYRAVVQACLDPSMEEQRQEHLASTIDAFASTVI
ncbi:MAG: hypothetical protein Q9159_006363 [Coniocarpon cinnabarinum]